MGVCSNELEYVAFASSRNFTRGLTLREGTLCIFSTQIFSCACRVCVPSVRADFGCERTKDVAAKREHLHTETI